MVSTSALGSSRKIILWLMALTVSLLALGIFNFVAMRRLDVGYSELVSRDLAAIGTMRSTARQSAETHRCLLNLVMGGDAAEKTRQIQKLQASRAANDLNVSSLATNLAGKPAATNLDAMRQSRQNYLRAADALIVLIDAGDADAVEEYRIKTVRPAYDAYLQVQDELADAVYAHAEARSRDLNQQSKRWQYCSLGLSTWPILTVVLIVGLMVWVLFGLGWRMQEDE